MRKILLFCLAFLSLSTVLHAQCPNDNSPASGSLTPSSVGTPVSLTYNSGQYVTAFVYAGANYTIRTCGSTAYDTQLTVFDNVTLAFIAYNDDFCSVQSQVNFTATACGTIRILLDQYSCNNSGIPSTVTLVQNTTGTATASSMTCAPSDTFYTSSAACGVTGFTLTPPTTSCAVLNGNDAPTTLPLGTTMVTWTATGASGMISCTQNIVVLDTISPVITCVNDTLYVSSSSCSVAANLATVPTPTDNCSIDTIFNNAPTTLGVGSHGIVWTVNDGSGNSASCTQNVLVIDSIAPLITCTNDTLYVGAGTCDISIGSVLVPIYTDNCSIDTVYNDGSSLLAAGTHTLNWTVVDVNGNSSVCMQTVTVVDTISPSITCPGDTTLPASAAGCSGIAAWSVPVTNDNCAVDTVYSNHQLGDTLTGTTLVTYTVVDLAGNINTCSFNVTIETIIDITLTTTPQSASSPNGTITTTVSGGQTPYTFDWSNDGTGDNNDTQDLTNLVSGDYSLIVTDSNGCTATDSITVNNTIGINNLANPFKARIYPNPSNGDITIELQNYTHNMSIEIYNTLGSLVKSIPVLNKETKLNMATYNAGMFLIKIKQDGNVVYNENILIQY